MPNLAAGDQAGEGRWSKDSKVGWKRFCWPKAGWPVARASGASIERRRSRRIIAGHGSMTAGCRRGHSCLMQDEPERGPGFSYKMSLKGKIGMLGIDHQHGRFRSEEPGADAGVPGRQWRGAICRATA